MHANKYSFNSIKPKVANDLIRIGNANEDGGYVISKRQIELTKILIGLGVNYDWSFEEDFKKRNKELVIHCYDFSVGEKVYLKGFISSMINVISVNSYTKEVFNKRSPLSVLKKPFHELETYFAFKSFFDPKKNNFFFQDGISNEKYDQFVTTNELFANIKSFESLPENSIYLKMDIEQSEYDVLEDILEHSDKINGMAIEFHDLRHFWKDFSYLIEKIKENFEIIHVHGNNCCGYIPGTQLPNFIELSVIKRSLLSKDELNEINRIDYPLPELDRPNIKNRPDLTFSI